MSIFEDFLRPFSLTSERERSFRAVSIEGRANHELYASASFTATVLHVFRSTINLELNRPGGLPLIGLVGEKAGNLPGAVLVDERGGLDWRELPLAPGMKATLEGQTLSIGPRVRVDLKGAPVWEARRTLPGPLAPASTIRNRLEKVSEQCAGLPSRGLAILHRYRAVLLAGETPEDPDLPIIPRAASSRIAALLHALRAGDGEDAARAALSLVGLGIGLTPSGDDVLVGLFGTFHLLNPLAGVPSVAGDVAERLKHSVSGRTSRVSELFLRAALRGEVSEVLARFVDGVTSAQTTDPNAVSWLLSHGSSSGAEIALGSLLGIDLLLEIGTDSGGIG